MSDIVIDSSVILAILKNESIDAKAFDLVDGGVMSAVNVAEVYFKLSGIHMGSALQVDSLLATLDRVEAFTHQQARSAGFLRDRTSHAGLSLGDKPALHLQWSCGPRHVRRTEHGLV